MIAFLKGVLIEAWPDRVVLDVRDVGYEIRIPSSTFNKLPASGQTLMLFTVLSIRETEHTLYGFASRQERDLFTLLVNYVSGVGPKMALAILSGTTPSGFQAAVTLRDHATLSRIKGVGKKTAERIIVELHDKMGFGATVSALTGATAGSTTMQSPVFNDSLLALISLGYKQPEALSALEKAGLQETVEASVRGALKHL